MSNNYANALQYALAEGTGTMAKRFLQVHGLTRGAGDSVAELHTRILQYREDGKLGEEAAQRLLRELWEAGDKRLYLFRAEPSAIQRAIDRHLASGELIDPARARVRVMPSAPVRNYLTLEDTVLRASYSEVHTTVRLDQATRTVVEADKTKVTVIEADAETGAVRVWIDQPGTENPHGQGPRPYFSHYLADVLKQIISPAIPVPVELFDQLRHLAHARFQSVVTFPLLDAFADDGLGMRLQCTGSADLRDYGSFREREARIAIRNGGRLRWMKSSGTVTPEDIRAGNALGRQLNTAVEASPGMIRFGPNTLSCEVAYVLRQIEAVS